MMNCEICEKEIKDDESRMIFRKSSAGPEVTAHACCFQEHFLFEVWNALSLGIKYESHCQHVDYASGFNPLKFTAEDITKAIEKQLRQGQGQRQGGRKWWRR